MCKFFRKKKNIEIRKMNLSENDQDSKIIREDAKTLGDLAQSGHSFFRFSQSQPGRSVENVYAEYIPGKITKALDEDKYLSFVTEETIAKCFMYGDMLTSLKFDINDEEFKKIADVPFRRIGGALGEYESKYLLVDQNYSLEDVNTIVKIFDYVTSTDQLCGIFSHPCYPLAKILHKFQYFESEKLVKYLSNKFENNIHISPDEIRALIREYLNE